MTRHHSLIDLSGDSRERCRVEALRDLESVCAGVLRRYSVDEAVLADLLRYLADWYSAGPDACRYALAESAPSPSAAERREVD